MSRRRLRVGILCGGESAEHEVSLQSAANVVAAIDRDRWEVVLIGIDREGRWHVADASRFLRDASDPRRVRLEEGERPLALVPGRGGPGLLPLGEGPNSVGTLDVVFPVLHGPRGEDGSVQGLLRMAHLPFVGAGVLGSAVAMDKDVTKRLLRDAGVPVPPFRVLRDGADGPPAYGELAEALGEPLFLKPANLGSSVGVHRVEGAEAYAEALEDAFSYDRKVLAETYVPGREIEVAVLGDDAPEASVPGEIVPRHAFYSYEAKYLDEDGAELMIPARLPAPAERRARELAVEAFRTLCCEGMARVDFFLREDGELLVNEINTIPGFTRISMYPKLWEASGVGYGELIDRLLELALRRAGREATLRTDVADL